MPILTFLHADVQETACATPVQGNIFVPELQQQKPRVQPSIPNDVAASQAAPAGIALPKDQLNPSSLDPQQPSPVVTPDQLLERPGCDSQHAGTLVTMQQPDSNLANQVQASTHPASSDDHSPAAAGPVLFADGNAAAIPSNDSNDSPAGPSVSSISKPAGAAQVKGLPASNAAAATASEQQSPPAGSAAATASEQQSPPAEPAAATASEQQSPPAEPTAAEASEQQSPPAEPTAATASEQQSPPAEPAAATASEQQSLPAEPTAADLVSSVQANSAFASSAMPTSSKLCAAALPPGVVAPADKPASNQGDLESILLGPLASAEAGLVAETARSTDEVHRVRTI